MLLNFSPVDNEYFPNKPIIYKLVEYQWWVIVHEIPLLYSSLLLKVMYCLKLLLNHVLMLDWQVSVFLQSSFPLFN